MRNLLLTFVAFVLSANQVWSQVEVKAAPNETVELMFVIMSLTEAPVFNPPHVLPEYKAFVDSHFAGYKNHSVIKFITKEIFENENIDMVAPALIGVNSDIIDGNFVYACNNYGWNDKIRDKFVKEVNKFYRDTNFPAFWEHARDNLYLPYKTAFNDLIIPRLNLGWLNQYIPVKDASNYGLTISLLSGAYNFGVSSNGIPNPVIGVWDINLILNPTQKTFETYLPLTMHEYLHPFCNPLIDKYYVELERPGEIIFPKIREQATKASYGSWRVVLYEALVRASEIAFMHSDSDNFFNQYLKTHSERDKSIGFYWIDELAELLLEYEANRNCYPTLDSFMPRIIDFYKELATKSEN